MSRRIFLTSLCVTVMAVILFGVPLAIAIERRNHDDAVLELQRAAATAASQVSAEFATSVDALELPAVEPEIRLGLYTAAGTLSSGRGAPTADPVVLAALDGSVHDGQVGDERVVAVPIAHDEQVTGIIRSSEPIDESSDRTHRAWLAMAAVAAIAIAAAGIAGALLARHLTRPVRALRDAAVRLGDGDFTATPPQSGITELDAVAAALAATAGRLGDLVEHERAFTADASHQLRNPLASLRVGLEAELIQPRSDSTVALNDALGNVDRLEAIVTHLLALARDMPADRGPLALGDILRGVERRWHAPLAAAGRRLHVDTDGVTPVVEASAAAVATVLDVLVDNAVRHGRGTVTVTASAGRPAGARVTVADEGRLSGDPNRLFERRSDQAHGHGIGLSLARSLAHAERGRLRLARPAPTTFELLLTEAVTATAVTIRS